MSDDRPSTSTSTEEENSESRAPFVTHQVTKLDTLAGLAVRYHVSVSDIKRSNGLLSDSAMYAKDTLLIPTRAMPPLGLEYQTWAGMIVTQYGRIPGDLRTNGIGFGGNGSHGDSPPRQSAALDKLQRYYGTGDTCSEPEDFRPGSSSPGLERMVRLARLGGLDQGQSSSVEIEMTELEGQQREPPHSPTAGLLRTSEYAGSREGPKLDERLRRRKGPDTLSEPEPSTRGVEPPEALIGSAPPRPPIAPRGSPSVGGATAPGAPPGMPQPSGRRRTSVMERLKRAASQPTLAGLPAGLAATSKGIVKAAEALIARSDTGGSGGGCGSATSSLRGSASAPGMGDPAALEALPAASSVSPGSKPVRRSSSNNGLPGLAHPPPKKKD